MIDKKEFIIDGNIILENITLTKRLHYSLHHINSADLFTGLSAEIERTFEDNNLDKLGFNYLEKTPHISTSKSTLKKVSRKLLTIQP